jgi:hypothetical protein
MPENPNKANPEPRKKLGLHRLRRLKAGEADKPKTLSTRRDFLTMFFPKVWEKKPRLEEGKGRPVDPTSTG